MTDTAIKIENLSKQYRLGQIGTGTLSHDVNRWWHQIRGKKDPYLKISEINDRSSKGKSGYAWALKDINFEVNKGEVLGIIGKNGAGKSTLLKILSKVTGPTTGSIKTKGRIASLLEVGTGFHPEMTGRENIYMNGTIMGMTRHEINIKLDEIVSFAGIERYLDTPVKRYSSGMTVRLGFSIAAHLEPEILIVDEVLAVGDIEFQKKAIGKMKSVSEEGGRTVLFVSHNMSSVNTICNKALVLKNGQIDIVGSPSECISHYYNNLDAKQMNIIKDDGNFKVEKLDLVDANLRVINNINQFEDLHIRLNMTSKIHNYIITFHLYDNDKNLMSVISHPIPSHQNEIVLKIDNLNLKPGEYHFDFRAVQEQQTIANLRIDNTVQFNISNSKMLASSSLVNFKSNLINL